MMMMDKIEIYIYIYVIVFFSCIEDDLLTIKVYINYAFVLSVPSLSKEASP